MQAAVEQTRPAAAQIVVQGADDKLGQTLWQHSKQ
jgi:hypothetical protein